MRSVPVCVWMSHYVRSRSALHDYSSVSATRALRRIVTVIAYRNYCTSRNCTFPPESHSVSSLPLLLIPVNTSTSITLVETTTRNLFPHCFSLLHILILLLLRRTSSPSLMPAHFSVPPFSFLLSPSPPFSFSSFSLLLAPVPYAPSDCNFHYHPSLRHVLHIYLP